MKLEFTKMHGLGNDFIVIDNMSGQITLSKEQIIFLCDRHRGVGADGVILIEHSEKWGCFMNYYNADGTLAEMCGNGVRCVAKFLGDHILKHDTVFHIDTRAGVKKVMQMDKDMFSVNMGRPDFSSSDFPRGSLVLEGLTFDFVSMGNPHAVAIVEDLDRIDISTTGPRIENNVNFPNKINVEFVQEVSANNYVSKVWERGSGETLACGTGACAIYAILSKLKKIRGGVNIKLPGGDLLVKQNEKRDIIIQGPAESIYTGTINFPPPSK